MKDAFDLNQMDQAIQKEYERLRVEYERRRAQDQNYIAEKAKENGGSPPSLPKAKKSSTENCSDKSTQSSVAMADSSRINQAQNPKQGKKGSSYHSVEEEHKGKSIAEREKEKELSVNSKAQSQSVAGKGPGTVASTNANNNKAAGGVKLDSKRSSTAVSTVASSNEGTSELQTLQRDEILDENELFKLISHDKNYDGYDYQLSYEMNPNATVPSEIEELGR